MLLLSPALAAEAADVFAAGDMGDDVLRVQLRLRDLGYQSAGATGVWRASDAAALDDAGGSADALFLPEMPRKALEAAEEAALPTVVYGGAMPWSEIRTRLTEGRSYMLTDCYTGVIVRLHYLGGEQYASMQPVLSWDSATMTSLFAGGSPLDARPVVLSVDGMLAAGSLRLSPLVQDGELTRAQLFFKGSGSNFAGLPDADHDAAVLIAATTH